MQYVVIWLPGFVNRHTLRSVVAALHSLAKLRSALVRMTPSRSSHLISISFLKLAHLHLQPGPEVNLISTFSSSASTLRKTSNLEGYLSVISSIIQDFARSSTPRK